MLAKLYSLHQYRARKIPDLLPFKPEEEVKEILGDKAQCAIHNGELLIIGANELLHLNKQQIYQFGCFLVSKSIELG